MLWLVFRTHQKGLSFWKLPFRPLLWVCFHQIAFVPRSSYICTVWIFLESGGLSGGALHMNEVPWRSLQAAGAGKEFLENPPKLWHSTELVQRRGEAPKLQHTEWFVLPNWGSSWDWQGSRLLEKPGRASSAARGCVTGFSVPIS